MRTRWDEKDEEDLDAPAVITERELRSLRRRAGLGLPAVFLALIAIGGLAWTLIAGPQGLQQIQDYKDRALYNATSQNESAPPAEPATASATPVASDSLLPPPPPADSLNPSKPKPAGQ